MTKKMSAESLNAVLPWYAAGTLDFREAAQVEAALVADDELARRLEDIREEMMETIRLNEALGKPSAQAMDRILQATKALPHHSRKFLTILSNKLLP